MNKINGSGFDRGIRSILPAAHGGSWPPRKIVANRPLPDDHMLRHDLERTKTTSNFCLTTTLS